MTRLERFESFASHPMHGKIMQRLKKEERRLCVEFITQHDHLDSDKFAERVNRWMLDQPKPKNFPIMWALVLQSNTTERK